MGYSTDTYRIIYAKVFKHSKYKMLRYGKYITSAKSTFDTLKKIQLKMIAP